MTSAEKETVATHKIDVSYMDRPDLPKLECRLFCRRCCHEAFIYVWKERYACMNDAEARAFESGLRSFRFDCADHLAAAVMGT